MNLSSLKRYGVGDHVIFREGFFSPPKKATESVADNGSDSWFLESFDFTHILINCEVVMVI